MTECEYMEVGYIRSNCLNKTIDLFKGTTVASLQIQRSQQERGKIDSPFPWIKYSLSGIGSFILDWDMWKHSVSFEEVVNILADFKGRYHFADFVVEKIQIGFNDDELVNIINSNPNMKQKVDDGCRVFVTFANTPLAYTTLVLDGQSDLIQKINLNAIVNLRFKKGVLDIKHVIIERKKKTFDNCDFLVHETPFLKKILQSLNAEDWYKLPEIKELHNPTPCAIRTYEMKENKKWTFIQDREIR